MRHRVEPDVARLLLIVGATLISGAAATTGDADPGAPRLEPGAWNVIVFVADDCPISNRYVPELERLRSEVARPREGSAAPTVRFLLVYAGPHVDPVSLRAHREAYALTWPAARDPTFELADRLGATVTPEAVVVAPDGEVVYRGRIDDRYAELGRARAAPRTRDLETVLGRIAAGERPEARVTEAVGCFIRGTLP